MTLSLQQADWLKGKLERHWVLNPNALQIIQELSLDKYQELTKLYMDGFFTSDTKPTDKGAVAQLDLELERLGIL